MISYAIASDSSRTVALARLLDARGARVAESVESADVVLASAASLDEADTVLASLGEAARKTIVLGDFSPIHVTNFPEPGNFEGLLEACRPLGVLRTDPADAWQPMATGFIGTKALASALDAGFIKAFSTPTYGAWLHCAGEDAADFVLRVVRAAHPDRP